VLRERGIYETADDIIYRKYYKNIKSISKIKPCDIVVSEPVMENNIEHTYNDIMCLVEDHKNLTINALLWATLCKSGEQMKFKDYLNEDKKKKKLTTRQIQLAIAEIEDGQSSISSIASRLGITVTYLNDLYKGNRRGEITAGIEKKPKEKVFRSAIDSTNAAVSDADVKKIYDRLEAGEKVPALAKEYGVADQYIRDIGKRARRKNVQVD
jgi:transposase-like protein